MPIVPIQCVYNVNETVPLTFVRCEYNVEGVPCIISAPHEHPEVKYDNGCYGLHFGHPVSWLDVPLQFFANEINIIN